MPLLYRRACPGLMLWLLSLLATAQEKEELTLFLENAGAGIHAVASTNFEINVPKDNSVENYMTGIGVSENGKDVTHLLKYPDDAIAFSMEVPDDQDLYREYAGQTVSIGAYVVYPTHNSNTRPDYDFPFGTPGEFLFKHMQGPGESPVFPDETTRFPVVISSHGFTSHGLWDLEHMEYLASHGFIAISMFHGDRRFENYQGLTGLRALAIRECLDLLLDHPDFRNHIDHDNIGISGTSLGGYTGMASMGATSWGNQKTIEDVRIKPGVGIVPYFGNDVDEHFPFGSNCESLTAVEKPYLSIYGDQDIVAPWSVVSKGMKNLNASSYAVALKGEDHVPLSDTVWPGLLTWELTFFKAYLQQDLPSLLALRQARYAGDDRNGKTYQHLRNEPELSMLELFGPNPEGGAIPVFTTFQNTQTTPEIAILFQHQDNEELGVRYEMQVTDDMNAWTTVHPMTLLPQPGQIPWPASNGFEWSFWQPNPENSSTPDYRFARISVISQELE